MADIHPHDMAANLLVEGFHPQGPVADAMSDPIADTPLVVTLDQLRPYEHNPRVTRNPLYDEIKTSIRERGLDAPPAITRRPGEAHYIIRNGGNTRLAILRELWAESKDERFFRILCLFRPWVERGEIIALTGHLAENELHGSLTFIERALGIEKVRELYEIETGKALSQSELARRLTADGYPVSQPHISRMQDTVRYLLPAIPNVLYGGLGRPQIERLIALRKTAERLWEKRALGKHLAVGFPDLFQEVLAMFDTATAPFATQRVQDELVGQFAGLLEADYDTLILELDDGEAWQRALDRAPAAQREPVAHPEPSLVPHPDTGPSEAMPGVQQPAGSTAPMSVPTEAIVPALQQATPSAAPAPAVPFDGHIASPAASTDRLQSIQRLVAEHTGEPLADFAENVIKSIPVQAGGLYPISDIWFIDPLLDAPGSLRIHIAQLAQEIAEEAGLAEHIESREQGIGFCCNGEPPKPFFARAVFALLSALSTANQDRTQSVVMACGTAQFAGDLAALLQGEQRGCQADTERLSDEGLVKLFRMIRLARRLLEWDGHSGPSVTGSFDP